jgi:glycosyltransferase involved in cell wall biosynthesis
LITDGVNGYLVDFNDQEQLQEAIIRVISHPESRERMTQSARLRSKDFQKNSVVQRMAHVLKTALSQK